MRNLNTPTLTSADLLMPKQNRTMPFVVRRSEIQGSGAFATRKIRKGQRVAEYVGEVIHPSEEEKRYNSNGRRHHTFLFGIDKNKTIDGGVRGNKSRFINHSCDPNCETIERKGRVFVYAIKPIAREEELTYDYHFEVEGRVTAEDKKYYKCRCGTEKCRGTILDVERMRRRQKRRLAMRRARLARTTSAARKTTRSRKVTAPKKRAKN